MNATNIVWVVVGLLWFVNLFLMGPLIRLVLKYRKEPWFGPWDNLWSSEEAVGDRKRRVIFKIEIPDGLDADGKPYKEEQRTK